MAVVVAAPRPTFAPLYGGSTWTTLAAAMRSPLANRKQPMTNAEAVALIREWRNVSDSPATLAYQFAAHAYGWDPPTSDKLATGAKQAARAYPSPDMLWRWVGGIAAELDARNDALVRDGKAPQPARVAVDRDSFTDPTFYGAVRAYLTSEGARADVAQRKMPAAKPPQANNGSGLLVMLAVAWLMFSPRKKRRRR
jgi:hypothetical protein